MGADTVQKREKTRHDFLEKVPAMYSSNQRVKRLQSAIERDSHNQGAHFMLGEEYMREQRFMRAAAKFRRVVELNPDHARAWMMMGKCYDASGIFTEAATAYDTAAYAYERQALPTDAAAAREAGNAARTQAARGLEPFREQF
jgi:cytochrome c-type biogenesis protein CcmH/NrfG